MPQIFHPSMNTISRVSIFGAVFLIAGAILIAALIVRSPYVTQANVVRDQPVAFSHQHHVADCGIDCRYCHTSVEESSFAGVPATEICMNCHAYLFDDQPALEPVRESYRTGIPLSWTRVHNLPDFAYFNHSIHVHKGIGCATCHGQVDEMPLMWREHSLHMEWCLECHRDPAQYIRPREEVFDMRWRPPTDEREHRQLAARLMEEYDVQSKTNCSVCHF